MKTPKITILVLVAGLSVAVGDIREAIANPTPTITAETRSQGRPIPISLPTQAAVILQDGGQLLGTVVEINDQYLIVAGGGSRGQEAIANISRVEFKENSDIWWPTSSGAIVIRGDDENASGNPQRLRVRVDGLVWENADQGIAAIQPEAIIGVDDQTGLPRSMRRDMRGSRYVVSAIEFEPQESILIITARLRSQPK